MKIYPIFKKIGERGEGSHAVPGNIYTPKDTCKLRTNSVRSKRWFLVIFTFLEYNIYNIIANMTLSFNLKQKRDIIRKAF